MEERSSGRSTVAPGEETPVGGFQRWNGFSMWLVGSVLFLLEALPAIGNQALKKAVCHSVIIPLSSHVRHPDLKGLRQHPEFNIHDLPGIVSSGSRIFFQLGTCGRKCT